ncbi:hypothetical protein N7540_004338 [Penicillium herquei]|nr:hypothetical protein N7540_004338 [Penicillium herquei]
MAYPPRDAFQIGWICALPIEAAAATEMLDEKFGILEEQDAADSNTYTLGRIEKHHVVIACLPGGQYGTTSATTVAINMLRTFSKSLRIGLMVGIGGGAPSAADIRLGDIVISYPSGTCGGVIQYDMGKIITGGEFERTGSLNSPPRAILTAISTMRATELTDDPRYLGYLQNAFGRTPRTQRNFGRPSIQSDRLFQIKYSHPPNASSCDGCLAEWEENRDERMDKDPQPHYGIIASSNKVIKDGRTREQIWLETGALCFEMEAAGLMLDFPCVVIRGICDYADSHKNKKWQGYAALAAAAYTKELLDTSDIRQTQITNEYDEILQWLATNDLFSKHNDLVQRRTKGTGKWFLESDEFQRWLKDPHHNQTLLCTGVPGAGKTFIVSIVISFLQRHFDHDTSVGTAYIYSDFKQRHIQKPWILIASLLKQLARLHPNLSPVIQLYENHQKYNTRPSLDDLVDVFQAVATSFSRVNILVDALDECQADDSLQRFLHIIFFVQAKSGLNISLFATSRHNGNIEALFESSIRLEICAGEDDIRSYLDQRINAFRHQSIKRDKVMREDFIRKISEVANGMFLLAELFANQLASLITVSDAKDIINELDSFLRNSNDGDGTRTRALDHAYEMTMSRIKGFQTEKECDLALRVLSWITCAKRPLSPLEIRYAIAVEPGTQKLDEDRLAEIEDLVSLCAGLVIVDQKSHIVRLVHYTTQEYLDRTSRRWFPDAHVEIARSCVTYLSFDNLDAFLDIHDTPKRPLWLYGDKLNMNQRFPLCRYAAEFWGHHARNTAIEEDELVLNFLQKIHARSPYYKVLRWFWRYSTFSFSDELKVNSGIGNIPETTIQVAVYFGLAKSISRLLNNLPEIVPEESELSSLLISAAAWGWRDVTELLLDQGAIVAKHHIYAAAESGAKEVLKLFFEKGSQDLLRRSGSKSLEIAVRNGKENTVILLFNLGVKPGSRDLNFFISTAIENGYEGITNILLDAEPDLEPTSLQVLLAIQRGHEGIVRSLLDRGASPEPEGLETSHLIEASKHGFHTVVNILLSRGVAIEAQDPDGWTALMWAVRKGHERVVKSLIQGGADVRSRNKDKTVYELALKCNNTFVLGFVEERLSELTGIPSETDIEPSDSELDLDEGDQELDEEY